MGGTWGHGRTLGIFGASEGHCRTALWDGHVPKWCVHLHLRWHTCMAQAESFPQFTTQHFTRPYFLNPMSSMPWCSCCGKEALPCSMKGVWGKWLYFCEGCAKGYCLLDAEGVKYGPVGKAWGLDRSDPIVSWTRNIGCSGNLYCTDGRMDVL